MVIKQLNSESMKIRIELVYLLKEFVTNIEDRSENIKKILLKNKKSFDLFFETQEWPKGNKTHIK